jgi:hypothetical protein
MDAPRFGFDRLCFAVAEKLGVGPPVGAKSPLLAPRGEM